MTKLWQKNNTKLHPLIEKFTVGDDPHFDKYLFHYDIRATKVHAKGLQKIGILNLEEFKKIINALNILEKNPVKIRIEDEDCHTVIENYLIEHCGEAGKKIHTGRSRNDQVLIAIRLYTRAENEKIDALLSALIKTLKSKAKKNKNTVFPGYSHMQQAMITSYGHYLYAFIESLSDDLDFLKIVIKHIDQNPLGSAAGFGVPLPLEREMVTKELGFKKTQYNSLYCQNSRGKFESLYLEGLSQIMLTLSKMAQDYLIFTSIEFDFFEVNEALVTGSSIMPQKRNLDGLEIIRGYSSLIISNQLSIKELTKNLMSGYNRDTQLMKKIFIESIEIVKNCVSVMDIYVKGLNPREEVIKSKISNEIISADLAINMSHKKNIPFRDAYKKVLQNKDLGKKLPDILKERISPGGSGNYLRDCRIK